MRGRVLDAGLVEGGADLLSLPCSRSNDDRVLHLLGREVRGGLLVDLGVREMSDH